MAIVTRLAVVDNNAVLVLLLLLLPMVVEHALLLSNIVHAILDIVQLLV